MADWVRSRLALGLAALGRPGYINLGHGSQIQDKTVAGMRDHAAAMMDLAWASGVRHFDAARSYGEAEAFLAFWLETRGIVPQAVTVSSKWGYEYTANWQTVVDGPHEVKEHSVTMLQKQWVKSQGVLGRWLDLYQIHSATLSTGVLENTAVLGELARLKQDHGIALGLSLSGTAQAETLERALAVQVDGETLFDSVQATFNLLERSAAPLLSAAHDAGWVVMVKEALANGRLTPANMDSAFATQRQRLTEQAVRLHTTPDALALAFVLAQPWTDVVLLGAARPEHLHDNLAAEQVAWDDAADAALADLVEIPADYWARRSALPWN